MRIILKKILVTMIFFLGQKSSFCVKSNDPSRYILVKALRYSHRIEAIYLDRFEQNLIRKKIHVKAGVNKSKLNNFRFTKSIASLVSKNSDNDVKVSYQNFGLDSYKHSNKKLKHEINSEVKKHLKQKNYKLVSRQKVGKDMRAIYYNKEKGEYLFRSIPRNTQSTHFSFPTEINYPEELNNIGRINGHSLGTEKRYLARTPWQLVQAKSKLITDMKPLFSNKSTLNPNLFKNHLESLKAKQSDAVRIRRIKVQANVWIEAWYSATTNQITYRRIHKKKDGKFYIQKESIYSLRNPIDFDAAFEKFNSHNMFTRNDLLSFQTNATTNLICDPQVDDVINSDLIPSVSKVLDKMHHENLNSVLPDVPVRKDDQSIVLSIKALGENHAVAISFSDKGDISGIKLPNKEKAIKHGLFIEEREKGLEGRSHFVLGHESDDKVKRLPLMEFSTYEVDLGKKGKTTKLSVKTRRDKTGKMKHSESEETLYNLKFNNRGNKILEIGKANKVEDKRIDPFNFQIGKNNKSSLTGLGFGFLKSLPGNIGKKRIKKEVHKAIKKEAINLFLKKGSSYNGALSASKIDQIINQIVDKVEYRTSNFSISFNTIEAAAAEEAYKSFSPIVLRSSLRKMLPDESNKTLETMVTKLMINFKNCLKKATKMRNKEASGQCMEAFAKETPVEAGKEIILLKLKSIDMLEHRDTAIYHYNSCIKEHYDPIYSIKVLCQQKKQGVVDKKYKRCLEDKIKKDQLGLTRIKSCLYSSFLKTTPKIVLSTLDNKANDLGKNINIQISDEIKNNSVSMMASCLESKKLAKLNSFQEFEVSISSLDEVDPQKFEKELTRCTAPVTLYVGEKLAKMGIEAELSKIKELNNKQIKTISTKVLSQGYKQCVEKLSQHTLNVDPSECVRVIKNLGVGHGAESLVTNMIGIDKYNQLLKKTSSQNKENPILCFENEHKRLLANLPREIKSHSRIKNTKASAIKKVEHQSDLKTASCLKKLVTWVSGTTANKVIEDNITSNPKFAAIKLSPKLTKTVDRVISECFTEYMKNFSTVQEVLIAKDQAVDTCGAAMLKDDVVQKELFEPVIAASLNKVDLGLSSEKKIELKEFLRKRLAIEIVGSETQDEILKKVNNFSESAIKDVVSFMIKDSLYDVFNGNKAEVLRVSNMIEEKLLLKTGHYHKEFIKGLKSSDKNELKKTVNEFTYSAIDIAVPEAINLKIKGLIDDGTFDNEDDALSSKNYLIKTFHKCIEKKKVDNHDGIEAAKKCQKSLTRKGGTYIIINRAKKYLKQLSK